MLKNNQNVQAVDYIDNSDTTGIWIPKGAIGRIISPSETDLGAYRVLFVPYGEVEELFPEQFTVFDGAMNYPTHYNRDLFGNIPPEQCDAQDLGYEPPVEQMAMQQYERNLSDNFDAMYGKDSLF